MSTFRIRNFSFWYPKAEAPALDKIDLEVKYSEFICFCGRSGSGKSTLLRQLKSALAPYGRREGEILFYGRPLERVGLREQAGRIGYVLQNPENQLVTDKVWHELAFGLESLGYDQKVIRLRAAEMASFFGIQTWFRRDTASLSGGQKQLLNLASVMAMQPDVLILDEPTAQLDPIAATDFLETLKKINTEIGTTIILSEQRLEEVFPMADRVIALENGRVVADETPAGAGRELALAGSDLFLSLPTPLRIHAALSGAHGQAAGADVRLSVANGQAIGADVQFSGADGRIISDSAPLTVRAGREWLTEMFRGRALTRTDASELVGEGNADGKDAGFNYGRKSPKPVIKLKDVWFRYEKNGEDVLRDLSLEVPGAGLYAIVGANGSGKSTALRLISGLERPWRGKVEINGRPVSQIKPEERFGGLLGVLPQNPQTLFVEKTVGRDLAEIFSELPQRDRREMDAEVQEIVHFMEIDRLLDHHPYDLSGGEQQRAALAKVLLTKPRILLLDEPTKGMDACFKAKFAARLKDLTARGICVLMVSHDVEFCANYADYCALFFDGGVVTENVPKLFFAGNSFYTTAANRMSRHIFENAVTAKDVLDLCRINLYS